MRNQIQGLQEEVSQLTSIRINLENELKTVKLKLHSTENELSRFKTDAVSELQLKVGAFERKLIDKDELLSKVSALLEAATSQKVNI